MKRPRLLIGILVAAHAAVLLAGFVAPYDPSAQARALPFAPPTPLHVFDADGRLHLPFVYALVPDPTNPDSYVEDTTRRYPVRLLVEGAPYAVLPGIQGRTHLFGVEAPARLSVLGTDGFGRDVLSRLLHGGRISLGAGLLATLFALGAGLLLGTLAGAHGGWIDTAIMRTADLFLAIPWLYLLFGVRAALPLDLDTRTTFLVLVALLGVVGWASPARLVRGVVLSARERTHVSAARGFGAGSGYLLWRHILPQTSGVVLTQAALLVPQYMLAEVALSFLGLGVGEPTPSWGTMLGNLQQFAVLTSYWWMFAPALALVAIAAMYNALTTTLQRDTAVTV